MIRVLIILLWILIGVECLMILGDFFGIVWIIFIIGDKRRNYFMIRNLMKELGVLLIIMVIINYRMCIVDILLCVWENDL